MSNLKDLMGGEEIQIDDYVGTVVGNLKIVGWNGKRGNPKKYIVECSVCKQDPELHGEGLFAMSKGHLERNCLPCGCSDKCNWTEDQYKIRANRSANLRGLEFLDWDGDFKGANQTKCHVICEDHGPFTSMSLSFLLQEKLDKGCPGCFSVRMGNFKRKDDSVMIERFMSSGTYAEGTIFTRSDRLDKYGHKKYWKIYCPVCRTTGEAHVVGLYKGSRCCDCQVQNQTQSYINLIKDGDNVVAIKFGVANNSLYRLKDQQTSCIFEVLQYGIWTYPNSQSCKGAERTCKHTLETGVLGKLEMSDGYTETTHPINIDKVVKIFEDCGGVRNI